MNIASIIVGLLFVLNVVKFLFKENIDSVSFLTQTLIKSFIMKHIMNYKNR